MIPAGLAGALALALALDAGGVGARVVSLTLLDERGGEASRFERYVDIHPGEPLEREAVRRTVRLLSATGAFEDVLVETTPVADGVAVTIRLKAAPRLAGVRVGGDSPLSMGDVRRLTRLRDGELLWPSRADRAARDVALALTERGYLEARASVSVERQTPGVIALVQVAAGPQSLVTETRVSGLNPADAAALQRGLQPRAGEPFSRRRALASVARLQRALRSRGFWGATVELREVYDPQRSHVALELAAQTGSRTALGFRGVVPRGAVQRSVRRVLEEGGVRAGALEEAAELIEDEYRRRGYRFVTTAHDEEPYPPDGRRIVFTTHLGAPSRVTSVRLEDAPPLVGLERLLTTRVGAPVDDARLERDANSLRRALEDAGYPEARVDREVPERAGLVPVVLRVTAGPHLTLAAATLDTPIPLPSVTAESLGLKPGVPFSVAEIARARTDLTTAYRNAGFPDVTVTVDPDIAEADGQVDVRVRVVPGARVEIDRILVAGLDHTREDVVRRELLFHQGEPLRSDRLLESQRRLSGLGLFRNVTIQELDPEAPTRRSLLVAVEEGPRTTLTYGLGAAGLGPADMNPTLRASAEVTRRNLGGLDRALSLFARLSFRGSRFLATYREPYVFGRKADLSATAFREDEERTYFSFERLGASLETTRTLSSAWSLIARYTMSRTRLSDLRVAPAEVDRQYQNGRTSGPSASVVCDTRDDPLDPRRGVFLAADVQLSHAALGGHSFAKTFVQAAVYQGLGRRLVAALGTRVGVAGTLRGQDLDLPERFFAGGHYSMRGFDMDGVLPQGGRALFVSSVELRCTLAKSFSLAGFSDVGNVFRTLSEVNTHLRVTAGVGVRYRTPVGPIRLDWARNLDPREGDPPQRWHITVGHAF